MSQDKCVADFSEMEIFAQWKENGEHLILDNLICVPCSKMLQNHQKVYQHIESEEHRIISLATGVYFNGQTEISDSFPEIYLCLLCGYQCYKLSSYISHLNDPFHKKIVRLLRDMCKKRKENHPYDCLKEHFSSDISHTICCELSKNLCRCEYCFYEGCNRVDQFITKILKAGHLKFVDSQALMDFADSSNLRYCCLCNTHFNSVSVLKQHLITSIHKRIEQFMIKIYHMVNGMNHVKFHERLIQGKYTFSRSLPLMYYCEICNFLSTSYEKHVMGRAHKRIKELKACSLMKKELNVANTGDIEVPQYYCKLCAVWRPPDAKYAQHFEDIRHQRIASWINHLKDEKNLVMACIDDEVLEIMNASPYCKLCDCYFKDSEIFKQHLKNVIHISSRSSSFKEAKTAYEAIAQRLYGRTRRMCSVDLRVHFKSLKYYLIAHQHKIRQSSRMSLKFKKDACILYMTAKCHGKSFHRSDYSVEMRSFLRNSSFEKCRKYSVLGKPEESIGNLICFLIHESATYSAKQEHYCELCDHMSYDSELYGEHLVGAKHRTMRYLLKEKKTRNFPTLGFFCELCSSTYFNANHFSLHLVSEEHDRKMCNNKEKSPSWSHPLKFNCELCEIFHDSFKQYEEHLETEFHKSNQRWLYMYIAQSLVKRQLDDPFIVLFKCGFFELN